MGKWIYTLLLLLLTTVNVSAQFSPPGLGEVHTATWLAVGLNESLNKTGSTRSATYLGIGTTSDPDNYNPFDRPAIYVVNQELTHRVNHHWNYSGAVSYRWQNEYSLYHDFKPDTPAARQEFRLYGRVSYTVPFRSAKYSFTYRPELRFFYHPDFTRPVNTTQFRSRFSGKAAWNLNSAGTRKLISSAELLFAANRSSSWQRWQYNEARFCLYYSVELERIKTTINLGYMNNIINKQFVNDAHYLAIDITFHDLL